MSRIEEQLIVDEGLKLKPYPCTAGKLTIGVGRNLDDRGITKEEALYLLRNDIKEVGLDVSSNLPWFASLCPARQDVLVNMAFNLGIEGLLKFKNTLKHVQAGEYDLAATGMLESKWAGQVGARASRLAQMMRTGEYL